MRFAAWVIRPVVVALVFLGAAPSSSHAEDTITAAEAAQYLDAICGATLPRFKNFKAKAEANGFRVKYQEKNSALIYPRYYASHETKPIDIIQTKTEAGYLTCTVEYKSRESVSGYYRRVDEAYGFRAYTDNGELPRYRKTSAYLILTQGEVEGSTSRRLWLGLAVPD